MNTTGGVKRCSALLVAVIARQGVSLKLLRRNAGSGVKAVGSVARPAPSR
jgi:hypothetical protein